MATQTQTGNLPDNIMSATLAREISGLESLWLDNLRELPGKASFYKNWLAAMKKGVLMDKAEELVAVLVEDRLEQGKAKFGLRVLLMTLASRPDSPALRAPLIKALRAIYGELAEFDEILKLSSLEADAPLTRGINAFQALYRLTPGQAYEHHDWGVGVVAKLDLPGNNVALDFPKGGRREMTPDGVRKFLIYYEPDHYLARRIREPEALLALGQEKPAELVKLVLANQEGSRAKQADLKALLSPLPIPAEDWSSWWTNAREALKFDPYIEFDASGGSHSVITLREEPKTFDEEVEELFFAPQAGLADQGATIQTIAKRPKDSTISGKLAARVAKKLAADLAATPADAPAQRAARGLMLTDLAAALPETKIDAPAIDRDLAALEDYEPALRLESQDYAARILEMLIARDGDAGQAQALALLPAAPLKIAQALWRLAKPDNHHSEAVGAINHLIGDPTINSEVYAWAMRNLLDGSWPEFAEDFPAVSLVPEILDNIDQWQHRVNQGSGVPGSSKEAVATAKFLLPKLRSALSVNKYDPICAAAAAMSLESAARFKNGIKINDGLPTAFKNDAERYLGMTRRDLVEVDMTPGGAVAELMCTGRAHYEKTMELREIKSVKLPKVTKEVEAARAEGDLKENAGYQYAKEEQRLLNQRLMTISQQLSSTRIMKADEIDASSVGFGTRVSVKNLKSGEEQTFTVLGRWEANPEKNIWSIEAPLPAQFLGRKPGDKLDVTFPGGGGASFEVLSVEGVLAGGEWDAPKGE